MADDVTQDFAPSRSVKHLQLVQFTARKNVGRARHCSPRRQRCALQILPQYILSTPRYNFPATDTEGSQQQLWQVVRAMLAKDLVAIASYAYNATAHPRVVCLMPKISKSGIPVSGDLNARVNLAPSLAAASCPIHAAVRRGHSQL